MSFGRLGFFRPGPRGARNPLLRLLLCSDSPSETTSTPGEGQQCRNPRGLLRLWLAHPCATHHSPTSNSQKWPRQTKPKKGQFMNFSQGHSGTKVQCESCLFSQGKTPEFTKTGEIHELFVLALFWFGLLGRLLKFRAPIPHPPKLAKFGLLSCTV